MKLEEFLKEAELTEDVLTQCGTENEDGQAHIVIDLNAAKKGVLNETLFGAFAGITHWLLKTTMGVDMKSWNVPVKFKGSRSQLSSFERAFKGERRYIRAAKKYGLDNPSTYKSKYQLNRAIRNFENTTGIKWPIE